MTESASAPVPSDDNAAIEPKHEVQPTAQQIPQPAPVVAAQSSATLTQLTQIPSYVPPHVWTTQALLDLHQKQNSIALANIASADDQRKKAYYLSWAAFVLISIIICFGLYLVSQNNPFGKDIIGATVLFLAGYLAGQGQKKT